MNEKRFASVLLDQLDSFDDGENCFYSYKEGIRGDGWIRHVVTVEYADGLNTKQEFTVTVAKEPLK